MRSIRHPLAALAAAAALASPALASPTPEDALREALEAAPNDASSMLRLAMVFKSQGRVDEAHRLIDRAFEIDPDLLLGQSQFQRGADTACGGTGPDVILGSIPSVQLMAHQDGTSAYGIGTTSCNIGDEPVLWQSSTPFHPVIAQNIYRIDEDRIEQVGVGFVKHGFLALSGSLCCSCSGGGGSQLGVGCSDPYSASLNGGQSFLGPRFDINPTTGVFEMPHSEPPVTDSLSRRCAVPDEKIDPALNPDAVYYAEGHYVAQDDAMAGNGLNNASHRRISFSPASGGGFNAPASGPTVRGEPAILAWPTHHPDVQIEVVDVPGDGRFFVGHVAREVRDGVWRYEYAVHNLNSERALAALAVPVPDGVDVANVNFKDVDYDDGEIWDETDWTSSVSEGVLEWATTTPFSQNPEGNALRWGTLYNFWFEADAPPTTTRARMTPFKPGKPGVVTVPVTGPSAPPCPADLTGDGTVNADDLGAVIAGWGIGDLDADLDGSGDVDANDIAIVIAAWGDC